MAISWKKTITAAIFSAGVTLGALGCNRSSSVSSSASDKATLEEITFRDIELTRTKRASKNGISPEVTLTGEVKAKSCPDTDMGLPHKISLSSDGGIASYLDFSSQGVWTTNLSPAQRQAKLFSHPDIVVEGTRMSSDGGYVGVMYMERQNLLTRLAGIMDTHTGKLRWMGVPYFLGDSGIPAVCEGGRRAVFTQFDSRNNLRNSIGTTRVQVYEAATDQLLHVKTDFRVVLNTAISPDCTKVAFVYNGWETDATWGDKDRYRLGVIDLTNPTRPKAANITIDYWMNHYLRDSVEAMVFSKDGSQIALRHHPDYTRTDNYDIDLRGKTVSVVFGSRREIESKGDNLIALTATAVQNLSSADDKSALVSYRQMRRDDVCPPQQQRTGD